MCMLAGQAKLWAAAAPEGGTSLRQRLQALSEHLASRVVAAIRLWDESHQAAEQAWQSHHERVEETWVARGRQTTDRSKN